MQQLSLFDSVHGPPVRLPVEANGDVLHHEIEADHTFRLRHPRMVWDRAEIEIHCHTNGLWMWSTSFMADQGGAGYRVGAKWGHFAETREDALFYACEELEQRLDARNAKSADALLILKWVAALKEDARAFQ